MAGKLNDLQDRKALLVARCDATRLDFIMDAQELRRRTRWIDTGYQVAQIALPRLRMLAPVAGIFLADHLTRLPRALRILQTAWQFGRQYLPFLQRS